MIRMIIGAILFTTTIAANAQSSKKVKMTNKEKAAAVNNAVQNGDASMINGMVREDYKQHTPPVPDGKKGLIALINKIASKEIPAPVITNVRSFEDGDFVVLHHDVRWPNRKVMIEVFRFKNGEAAEHWSAMADHPEKTVSGNSMVDALALRNSP